MKEHRDKINGRFLPKHGMIGTRVYESWIRMKERCRNPKNVGYHDYGGRGITYCESWENFINFYKDMGDRPKGKTLDKIDNNKGYCKENCRWSTPKEQANNRKNNTNITYKGETKNIKQWSEHLGIPYTLLWRRIRKDNWNIEYAFNTPALTNASRLLNRFKRD